MPKRKNISGDDSDRDTTIPLPIQTFFWRQTSPFIRPKLGKLSEASCVSFERVVVQNILHGLSPSLCEAIQSISRWRVIQAAFPHLMHACASLLCSTKFNNPDANFTSSETKLLYILHWIILDAASECEDLETDPQRNGNSVQLHSLSTIQLFIYLFAPLIHCMKDSDFQTLKLENGLRLWQPLWDYRQPDLPCFSTPVKPQRNVLKAQRNLLKVNTNAANIYIGKGTSREDLIFDFGSRRTSYSEPQSPLAPLARMSDICALSTADSHSVNYEAMCEHCNTPMIVQETGDSTRRCSCGRKESLVSHPFDAPKISVFQRLPSSIDRDFAKQRLVSAVTSGVRGPTTPDILSASYFDIAVIRCLFCLHWSDEGIFWALRYMHHRLLEVCDEFMRLDYMERERSRSLPFPDIQLLQSMSLPRSSFEKYLELQRKNSANGIQNKKPTVHVPTLATIPSSKEISETAVLAKTENEIDSRREPAFKRNRVTELKNIYDVKVGVQLKSGADINNFTKAQKSDSSTASRYNQPTKHPVKRTYGKLSKDELSSSVSTVDTDPDIGSSYPVGNNGNNKSVTFPSGVKYPAETDKKLAYQNPWMTKNGKQTSSNFDKYQSHHIHSDRESFDSSSRESSASSQLGEVAPSGGGKQNIDLQHTKPVIRITEHSNQSRLRNLHLKASSGIIPTQNPPLEQGISRSLTDSHINYHHEEDVHEVPGSVYYIQDNGHLNYKVILRAVHFIAMNQRNQKICEVLLNIITCLLDLDIIERKKPTEPESAKQSSSPDTAEPSPSEPATKPNTPENTPASSSPGESMGKHKGEVTAHGLAMESLLSIFKALGCSHGCSDGVRGPHGDHLRSKGHNCLQRLQRINPALFRTYLRDYVKKSPIQETVDFLHAFLGFCIDPTLILQMSNAQQGNKKANSQEKVTPTQNGFSNNFGHSIGGVGYRGVEGVLIANILKPFVTRCVESTKELYSSDNISLFCDVRQLIAYVKEIHGGTFRRVELSALLDSYHKLQQKEKEREEKVKAALPIRRTTSQTSESGDESKMVNVSSTEESGGGKPRRNLLKKKLKKSLTLQAQYAASDSELLDEVRQNKQSNNTNAVVDDESGSGTTRRRFSKFHLGWKRTAKSDHEDDNMSDPPPLDRRESKSEIQFPRPAGLKGKMSFKTASHATITFLSAKKRIEGGLKSLGKRMSKRGSVDDWKQQQTAQTEDTESETLIFKEKKLVDKYIIKSGMLRFAFLLECCPPGSIPDPQLVAAMLELEAPVTARASMLLECAHFIHRCNHGDWPNWMRLNIPSFRQSASALQSRGQPSGFRRTLTLQKAAGRMFYSWAENLGCMLEYILSKEYTNRLDVISDIYSDSKKKELRSTDEEEDFLDEATVNENGSECPYALKMIACLVLQEITTFLRETFRDLPKSRSPRRETIWERNMTSRRWSSIVSSPGHSQSSESNVAELSHSASGVAVGSPSGAERKISFAVLGDRSDSIHSSTTSISMLDPNMPPHTPVEERKGRRLAHGRQKLLKQFRRGSGHNTSFRHNRSFRLKRQEGGSIKRFGSIKSRKVSSQSLQSGDKVIEEDDDGESVLSEDIYDSGENHPDTDDTSMCQNMPWIKVVIQLSSLSNFICTHQNFCHPNCYERQRRSCSRLVTALRKIYQSSETDDEEDEKAKLDAKRDLLKERLRNRGESVFHQTSPTKRRESTPLLEKIKSDVSISKIKLSSTTSSSLKKEEKIKEVKEDSVIVRYLTSQAQKLTQCPMGIIAKAAPILSEENLTDILPVAWELILESDQELAAAAASVFLLTSVKSPENAHKLIVKELQHEDTAQRINAVLRFGTLWKFRYQVWPRMEDGANLFFKIPPPNIDFTLPSPTIGLPSQTVVDPPWTPHFKAKIEEVTVNQEETKSVVTATTTRRKEQQEMIRKALQAEEERKRVGRETFPMTTVGVCQLAAHEPALHHASEEHEEAVIPEELNLAARRVSLAPVNIRANIQSRSLSWRNGSVHWGRLTLEGEEERAEHMHHMQLAQIFFPSCICAAVLPIIHLMDDMDVNTEGTAVCEVAEKVIWGCIVEDPVLFLRHFLEKLTVKDKQEELMFLLRKMILHFRTLPAQMAHSLFNYLIGYVMFYVRSPCSGSQEAIAGALSLIWQVVPSVEGIYFKDLKQTLKKEQCDPYILVSANVPSAKKIIVHGPDLTSIPSQMPIHEDTQFSQILQESLDFFNILEEDYPSYFLADTKSSQIHNLNSYVRDFYFFRRNFYPQLSLIHMNANDAFEALQKQAFVLKFVEIGKILFTTAVLRSTPSHQTQNHVSFLHEEFLKLPSFPRKSLEAEFGLYHGKWGEELFGLDTLHKYSWVKLMDTMFKSMSSSFNWTSDLMLFLNVINGCIILHCDDTAMLRYCLATLINTSKHFKHIFAMNGFLYVMPTLLKTYSNNQPNPVLCRAIEFVCHQFYILHRKPFILQMFGSVTPLLDMTSCESGLIDCRKVQPDCLFKLLLSLDKENYDNLSILDLVEGDLPLKALDFCYENDPDRLEMIEVINMCVTVIAYAPDSFRTVQMLTVLEVVVSRYLEYLKADTTRQDNPGAARVEIGIITNIGVSIRALISSCEYFTRSMSLPRQTDNENKPNLKTVHSNHSPLGGATSFYDEREDSHASRHMEEGRKKQYPQDTDDEEKSEFRKPRDLLLNFVSAFCSKCQVRLRELRKMLADPSFRPPELLDHKCHNRLAEITHTLLKLVPYDPITLSCKGLQRYMTELLPIIDWKQEAMRPGLNLILRRLDRLFNKISKKSSLRRQADWNSAANLLKGLFLMLKKFQYFAHLPHLKTLVNALLSIILSGPGGVILPDNLTGLHGSHRSEHPAASLVTPPSFCSAVIKLTAMQMQALGEQFSLEQICGGTAVFSCPQKCASMMLNFILPLCICVGCGRRDMPRLRSEDINFALTVILNVLSPPLKPPQQQNSTKSNLHHMSMNENHRCSSVRRVDTTKTIHKQENEFVLHTAYLGLQILMTCFDKILSPEWHKVARCIHTLGSKGKVSLPLWKFLDFLVTHRSSMFLLLQPFIQYKMMKVNCDTAQEYYLQQTIKDKLQGYSFTHPKCRATILLQLALELQQLKEDFNNVGIGEYRSRSATMTTERSEFHQTQIPDTNQRNTSVTDIATEIITAVQKPSLDMVGKRPSKGTIFSQSSSGNSAPFKTTALTSSMESDSPDAAQRKTSRRISAKEGSCILERFKQPTIDDNINSGDAIIMSEAPRLSRQPTIVFRSPGTSKQSSLDESYPAGILYENEEMETPNGAAGVHTTHTVGSDLDPKAHRLQRQDAKSRKTFKRKKTKTASVRRYVQRHRYDDHSDGEGASTESSPTHATNTRMRHVAEELKHLQHAHASLGHVGSQSVARSVETIPETVEMKPSRPRYIQRSKSHDDPHADFQAPAGTARGRIARQGARIVRSRSPSCSPVHSPIRCKPSPLASPIKSHVYVAPHSDSSDSLNVNESSALLKEEEKKDPDETILVYFDERETHDTVV